jgi:hypothetical protein
MRNVDLRALVCALLLGLGSLGLSACEQMAEEVGDAAQEAEDVFD